MRIHVMGVAVLLTGCADLFELDWLEASPDAVPVPAGQELAFGPPDAKPGECWARVAAPLPPDAGAATREVTETVLATPGGVRRETIPATFRTVTEQVMVEPAGVRLETLPERRDTVIERVLVEPERIETVEEPDIWETVVERVEVEPARQVWKPGGEIYAVGQEALGGTIIATQDSATGVMCLVEIPAVYEEVTRRVLVQPARTVERVIPAVYEEVAREVVVAPERTVEVPTPPVYELVQREVIDEPERVIEIPVPPTYTEVTRLETAEAIPADIVEQRWVQVLCDVNATQDLVRSLQRALAARDLYAGPIDGIIGPETRKAILDYQVANGTASEVLTLDSARALGLAL